MVTAAHIRKPRTARRSSPAPRFCATKMAMASQPLMPKAWVKFSIRPAAVKAEMAAVRQRDRDTISPLFQDLRETKPVYGQMLSFLKEQGGTSDRVSLELGGVAVLAALTDESAFSFLPANLQWRQGALA